jgi:glucose-1-phosphate adenylyltransferase
MAKSTSLLTCCRRSSGSTRNPGIAVRQTPSTRTSISSKPIAKAPEFVVILAGDHVYKMNYAVMLVDHVESGAECTVACIEVPRHEASGFGVMAVDENGMITDFIEKPADPPAMPGKPDMALCSMGVYVFNAKYLYAELARDIVDPTSNHDFGKDIIPRAVANRVAAAHPFSRSCIVAPDEQFREHYWRDAGTIDAYWDANIDLTATVPALNLYDRNWPVWTYQQQLPPAKFVHNHLDRRGNAIESTVSSGCIVSGEVNRSLLFSGCRVHSYSRVNLSVVLPDTTIGSEPASATASSTATATSRRGWSSAKTRWTMRVASAIPRTV